MSASVPCLVTASEPPGQPRSPSSWPGLTCTPHGVPLLEPCAARALQEFAFWRAGAGSGPFFCSLHCLKLCRHLVSGFWKESSSCLSTIGLGASCRSSVCMKEKGADTVVIVSLLVGQKCYNLFSLFMLLMITCKTEVACSHCSRSCFSVSSRHKAGTWGWTLFSLPGLPQPVPQMDLKNKLISSVLEARGWGPSVRSQAAVLGM